MGGNGVKWPNFHPFPLFLLRNWLFRVPPPPGLKGDRNSKGLGEILVVQKPREMWDSMKFCDLSGISLNFRSKLDFSVFCEFLVFAVWHPRYPSPKPFEFLSPFTSGAPRHQETSFYGELLFSMRFRDFLWKSPDFHWICDFQWFPSSFPFVHPEYPSRTIAKPMLFKVWRAGAPEVQLLSKNGGNGGAKAPFNGILVISIKND